MSKDNDQVVRTLPNTDIGGHDTAGVDGKTRTERSGEILGTPDPDAKTVKEGKAAAATEAERADYVRQEVDRANREDLPRLGGNVADTWEPGDSKGKPVAAPAAPAPAAPAPAPAPAPAREGPRR